MTVSIVVVSHDNNSHDTISLNDLTVNFDEKFTLHNINWQIESNQHWVITGANGSGKSALAAVLAGVGDIESGNIQGTPQNIGVVSFEAQAELIAQELKKDDADIMDVISLGTPVHEKIFVNCQDPALAKELVEKFSLTSLLDRAFRKLSTGETRNGLTRFNRLPTSQSQSYQVIGYFYEK